ncbi:MAG: transcriptional repressor LexA [Candidatus Ratteibacteria bacterium]|nr:transcriptional repressor LexA [Candidatus Ratteibacteria bacterium]
MLTKRQKEILDYIHKFITDNDFSPSLEEIARHFKLSSVSTVHQHIAALKAKNYLTAEENQPRSINVYGKEDVTERITLPLLGIIAAGRPIEIVENAEPVTVSRSLISRSGRHYVLKVKGESMINEGIFDGDFVIIREQPTAEQGDTIVAVINNNEATLKKFYINDDLFMLKSANPYVPPIATKELVIRGKVISIIRNLNNGKGEIEKSYKSKKRRIDCSWDFRGENTKSYTHGLHNYPAMFIPQVARRIILNCSQIGDTICDIFCGSGTALVESRLLGRNAYGIELNPLGVFLAKVKTTPLKPEALQKTYLSLLSDILDYKPKKGEFPQFFNINFWFKENVIYELTKIKKCIDKIKNKDIKDFFLVTFSETVKFASNTRNGEFKLFRMPKEKLNDYNPNVISIFNRCVEKNIKGMKGFYNDLDNSTWVKILQADSTERYDINNESIDCIITSPPYGDSRTTVAYGQFSRLSLQWLDMISDDDLQIDRQLMGGVVNSKIENNLNSRSLAKILSLIAEQDSTRAKEVLAFYLDLNKATAQAYRILKRYKYFCVVIGNRTVKKVKLPTDFIVSELGENLGFHTVDIIVRNIPNKRMPLRNSPTNKAGELAETIQKESIVILQKM